MADAIIQAEIDGLKETQAKMEQVARDLTGGPMVKGMKTATLLVYRTAQKPGYVPVDRGVLRASITPQVVTKGNEVQGIVGSNKKYAPFQELGTRPFTPPWTPIFEWAKRKLKGNVKAAGALTVAVRASIAAHGIVAKRFLQRALEDNTAKIQNLIGDVVGRIVKK